LGGVIAVEGAEFYVHHGEAVVGGETDKALLDLFNLATRGYD
jgi:hypothetical protein